LNIINDGKRPSRYFDLNTRRTNKSQEPSHHQIPADAPVLDGFVDVFGSNVALAAMSATVPPTLRVGSYARAERPNGQGFLPTPK